MKKIIPFLLLLCISLFSKAQTVYPDGLKKGDTAPLFSATDQSGKKTDLGQLLKKGDVVLIFYRGQWCPYCNKQLSRINDSLAFISAKGATVIAITPEAAKNIEKTIEKTKATYPIIEDKGLNIMKSYKVNFAVDEKTIEKYKGYGIDFETVNGSNGANLPVPATYIIDRNGKIKYAFFSPDYRQRASVKEILDNL